MTLNVGKEVAALQRLTVKELRSRYAEAFGEDTNANNRDWLIERIAWRVQALAEGGLSERARRRAEELANDADLRLSPPKVEEALTYPSRPTTLDGVNEEIRALDGARVSEDEVGAALAAFDPLWGTLTPREQGRIVQLLVQRVDYDGAEGRVSITFQPSGIKTLADELAQLTQGENT